MKYNKKYVLKNGKECLIRNLEKEDAQAFIDVFKLSHEETDNMLTYSDEFKTTVEDEAKWIVEKTDSHNEVELGAFVDGKLAGTAGFEKAGDCFKIKHRAEFGIGLIKEFCGMGIGTLLLKECIQCAKEAGYSQLELDYVAGNKAGETLYKKYGFVEFGRNPKGFKSRFSGYQELVYMRLDLE